MSLQRGETLPQCSPHATCLRGQSPRPSDSAWGRTKMVVQTSFSKGGRGGREGGRREKEGRRREERETKTYFRYKILYKNKISHSLIHHKILHFSLNN